MRLAASLALLLTGAGTASAHDVLDSLVEIEAAADGHIDGRWDIPLTDLEDLWSGRRDTPQQRAALAAQHSAEIAKAVADDLAIALGDGRPCPLRFGAQTAAVHKEQPYVALPFTARCPDEGLRAIQVIWTFLNEDAHKHQALVSFRSPGGSQAAILSTDQPVLRLAMVGHDGPAHFLMYLHDGALHIWTGADHLLFLLTLMLPSVLVLRARTWLPRPGLRDTAVDALKTVSAFTLAHSLTLALVTFHVVSLPTRLVVSVVALSVLLAGLNNLFAVLDEGRWKLAFVFGLVHGIGFADVLVDLALPTTTLLNSLAGFNAGVELGQLAVVAAFLPAAYLLRATRFYRRIVFIGGSAAAAVVAALWLVDRAFNLGKMPF